MKWIRYRLSRSVNTGTEEHPVFTEKTIRKKVSYSEENLAIVLAEADNGAYTVEDDGLPEPPTADSAIWDELDAAYQEGYEEGYTEGVNSAYDQ